MTENYEECCGKRGVEYAYKILYLLRLSLDKHRDKEAHMVRHKDTERLERGCPC
jgi:hypothetical protein